MEKYKTIILVEKIRKSLEIGKCQEALEIAEKIDKKKLKNLSDLSIVAECYFQNQKYEDAKELFLRIYDKTHSRRIVAQLVHLSIKLQDVDGANHYLAEFVEIAPEDFYRYIFQFSIDKLTKAPIAKLIEDLESLKKTEYIESWAYELAKLYHKAGLKDKCIMECNDIVLWFGNGDYVERAKALRAYYLGELDTKVFENEESKMYSQDDGITAEESLQVSTQQSEVDEIQNDDRIENPNLVAESNFNENVNLVEESNYNEGMNLVEGTDLVEESDQKEDSKLLNETNLNQDENLIEDVTRKEDTEQEDIMSESNQQTQSEQLESLQEYHAESDDMDPEAISMALAHMVDEIMDSSESNGEETLKEELKEEEELPEVEVVVTKEDTSYDQTIDLKETKSIEIEAAVKEEPQSKEELQSENELQNEEELQSKEVTHSNEAIEADEVEEALYRLLEEEDIQNNPSDYVEKSDTNEIANEITNENTSEITSQESKQSAHEKVHLDVLTNEELLGENFEELLNLVNDNDVKLIELFGHYMRMDDVRKQILQSLDQVCANFGKHINLIITGETKGGKTNLAKLLVKTWNRMGVIKTTKIALIDGMKLNQIDLVAKKNQLKDCIVVIEHAGKMSKQTVKSLQKLEQSLSDQIVFILEDTKENINHLLHTNSSLNSSYTNRIHLSEYLAEDFAGFVYDYITSKDYEIEAEAFEEVTLQIRKLVEKLTKDEKRENAFSAVFSQVDRIIKESEKRSAKELLKMSQSGRFEESDLMVLKKEDIIIA